MVDLRRGDSRSCHEVGAAAALGNVTMTLVPLLGLDCNAISAPCSRAIQLAIDRPRPARAPADCRRFLPVFAPRPRRRLMRRRNPLPHATAATRSPPASAEL